MEYNMNQQQTKTDHAHNPTHERDGNAAAACA
jgi:hypothetical protein